MSRRSHNAIALLLAGIALAGTARAGSDPDLVAGDVLQILVPAIGLGMTYRRDDVEGRHQWLGNTATTLVATQTLKYAFADSPWGTRPNGGPRSFPSGHTASACSGAFFLGERYGWKYGAPALAAAAFTGYSRVDEEMHYPRDVIAGCALAYAVSRYRVTPLVHDVAVVPVIGRDEIGVAIALRY